MHNIKIKYGFIQGITRSGISHAREGKNPLSHTKTDVWRLTHLHEAGRLDRLSVSSTHSYMMKTNRGMFPGQRREMEFSWFARKENLPRRVWQLPSVCTTVSSLGGGGGGGYLNMILDTQCGRAPEPTSFPPEEQSPCCCQPGLQLMTNLSLNSYFIKMTPLFKSFQMSQTMS